MPPGSSDIAETLFYGRLRYAPGAAGRRRLRAGRSRRPLPGGAAVTPRPGPASGGDRRAPGASPSADARSRLLVTSRYDFELPDGAGGDLARIWCGCRCRRCGRASGRSRCAPRCGPDSGETMAAAEPALIAPTRWRRRRGNPGLQDVLTRPILAGETAAGPGRHRSGDDLPRHRDRTG